jgi:hypothetical protein
MPRSDTSKELPMTHPSFDIISNLGRAEFCKPDYELVQAFKTRVWDMPVYIPGERFDLPHSQCATHFSLTKGVGKGYPRLPLYVRESDVAKATGADGYFAAKFHVAILFSESYRADAHLIDDGVSLLIPHEKMLELRDMTNAADGELPSSADATEAQRGAMLAFAARARTYCARHAEVHSLHLATLTTRGARPMLVGKLHAALYAKHARALQEISMDVFQPGWRFLLLEEAPGHTALIRQLRAPVPCYAKVAGQSWWDALKSQFATPALSLARLSLG